jgi:phosphatidylserine decarboxylase
MRGPRGSTSARRPPPLYPWRSVTLGAVAALLLALHAPPARAQTSSGNWCTPGQLPGLIIYPYYSNPVYDLRGKVLADPALAAAIDAAINDPERNDKNYWHGKGRLDLYQLLYGWARFMPQQDNVANYYNQFSALFLNTTVDNPQDPAAKKLNGPDKLLQNPTFDAWLDAYVKFQGKYLDGGDSGRIVNCWMQATGIDMDQYVIPYKGYGSFNEFFTRGLKADARPVAGLSEARAIVAPGDCNLQPARPIDTPQTELLIKGEMLDVEQLLKGSTHATDFNGGEALVCRLEVYNYHRMHAPVDGKVVEVGLIPGQYYGEPLNFGILTKNHRGYVVIQTDSYGLVGVVPVGIATISSVNITVKPGDVVRKGDEMGFFKYGGSVIVMLFQRNRLNLEPYRHMGERLGTMNDVAAK